MREEEVKEKYEELEMKWSGMLAQSVRHRTITEMGCVGKKLGTRGYHPSTSIGRAFFISRARYPRQIPLETRHFHRFFFCLLLFSVSAIQVNLLISTRIL